MTFSSLLAFFVAVVVTASSQLEVAVVTGRYISGRIFAFVDVNVFFGTPSKEFSDKLNAE